MRRGLAQIPQNRPELKTFLAPTKGWISNLNLAVSDGGGAYMLENIFPTAQVGQVRRGSELYATLGSGSLPVASMFTYNFGNNKHFFSATDTTIYDITTITSPTNYQLSTGDDEIVDDVGNNIGELSTTGLDVVTGTTSGAWIDEQFSTTGGNYLVIVNGQDPMQLFDGSSWYQITDQDINRINYDGGTQPFVIGDTVTGGTSGATAVVTRVVGTTASGYVLVRDITGTFQDNEPLTGTGGGAALVNGLPDILFLGITGEKQDGTPLLTSDLSYVWSYKGRLFFLRKDSLDAYYLDIDQIGGELTLLPLGAELQLGGKLYLGSSWSVSVGSGLEDNCIFVTDEGEILVYSGINPDNAPTDWQKVGRYQLGKPRGPKAFIRAGGDLVFVTDIGFVALSSALQVDYSVISSSAVSYPIETAWNDAMETRLANWDCIVWPERQMVIVSLPTVNEQPPEMFVSNARTGAWAKFTGWDGTCLEIFNGRLFYGSQEGKVIEAWVTGLDQGQPYTATYVPLFDDLGRPGSDKIGKLVRSTTRGPYEINKQHSLQTDYLIDLPAPPAAATIPVGSQWGVGVWGQSTWGGTVSAKTQLQWDSIGGMGEVLTPSLQITSGAIVPLDTEIIKIEMTYESLEVVS